MPDRKYTHAACHRFKVFFAGLNELRFVRLCV
jgi:hypothetical protein